MDETGIDPSWIDFGIVDTNRLSGLLKEFRNSEDKNTEHYRWKVFIEYLNTNKCFSPEKILKLFGIVQLDPDLTLCAAMIIEIIERSDATTELLTLASEYDNRSVKRRALSIIEARQFS